MSNGALQRTVRRTGAVVVVAVAFLTSTVVKYVQFNGLDVQLQLLGSTVLGLGAIGYLSLSFLLSALASFEAGADGVPDGE